MNNRVFIVVTDQAANMMNAFENEKEAYLYDEIVKLNTELLKFKERLI